MKFVKQQLEKLENGISGAWNIITDNCIQVILLLLNKSRNHLAS